GGMSRPLFFFYAIFLAEETGRGTVVLGTYGGERRQCPTGAWPGQDHARREGDLLWGVPGGTALECTTDTVHRTRSRPCCALGRQRTPLLPVLLVEGSRMFSFWRSEEH